MYFSKTQQKFWKNNNDRFNTKYALYIQKIQFLRSGKTRSYAKVVILNKTLQISETLWDHGA